MSDPSLHDSTDNPDSVDSSELRDLISELREEVHALRHELFGSELDEQLLTREEAAEHLRISVRTLDDMEETGEIQAVRIRGRVLYHRETLDAFIHRHIENG